MSSAFGQQRAIITGASSGIGKATALAFAQAGIDVALVGRSQEKLEQVAKSAIDLGVKASAYSVDLGEITEVKSKIAAIASEFGGIDILVNNAGMGYTKTLAQTPLSDWELVLKLNLTSVFQCVQAVLPMMQERKKGTIINIASIAAHIPFPDWGAYSVTKAGLVTFSKILAAEERVNGIRVMIVSPGSVNTSIWDTDTVKADFNRNAMLKAETVAQSILYAALLPADAVVEEVTIMPSAGAL